MTFHDWACLNCGADVSVQCDRAASGAVPALDLDTVKAALLAEWPHDPNESDLFVYDKEQAAKFLDWDELARRIAARLSPEPVEGGER